MSGKKLTFQSIGGNTLSFCWISHYRGYVWLYALLLRFSFHTYVIYGKKSKIFSLNGFHRWSFNVWAVARSQFSPDLQHFYIIPFSCNLAAFPARRLFLYHFHVSRPLQSQRKGIVFNIEIKARQPMFTVHAEAAGVVVAWWAGLTRHAELQFLHPSAASTGQIFHAPHEAVKRTKTKTCYHRTVHQISPFPWE